MLHTIHIKKSINIKYYNINKMLLKGVHIQQHELGVCLLHMIVYEIHLQQPLVCVKQ
jgi:hypothetical protein